MPFTGLSDFIALLEKKGELHRVKTFVDPVLEITEITDRISKAGGKALLFENTGKQFPLLINAFGSDKRIAIALGKENLDEIENELLSLFNNLTGTNGKFLKKLTSLSDLIKISGFLPTGKRGKGICQQVIIRDPDLTIFPVLKCWPHDGGRFITLPMVHTVHPVTGKTNVGMYRMQIIDKNTTAMHWQLHKTGAGHFEAWKKTGKKMPVSVTLGGDPAYTYSATAPLPENVNEYILAGFLRKKKVKLVKCITNDLCVPYDADIVIEGFVDPAEELFWEGPFGDHTGFYSLADWYPKFHVTCITHSYKAVYPATIVGIPPMEDQWFTKATEKIFLAPVRFAVQPEIEDLHMPSAGVAHNLVIVKINKTYPGQGKKVINSLLGAGQMMFTKYLVVVSGDINLRDYKTLFHHVLENTDFRNDLLLTSGPLDVLDHSSDIYSLGGKLGIDGSKKLKAELKSGNGEIIREVNKMNDYAIVKKTQAGFMEDKMDSIARIILGVDNTVDAENLFMVAWQILGNSDPQRDIKFISDNTLFIDGTIKVFHQGGFPRKWPNVVCSSEETIKTIDYKWGSLDLGPFIPSPSIISSNLSREGTDEILLKP